MSIKCPDCGHVNSDDKIFCEECGEPIDPKTRLIMELEGQKAPTKHHESSRSNESDDDDDDYIPHISVEEENKNSPIGWILALAAAAAIVYFLFLR